MTDEKQSPVPVVVPSKKNISLKETLENNTVSSHSKNKEIIIDSEESLVYIIRKWIEPKVATEIGDKLRKIEWEEKKVLVYGKWRDQNRRTYACGDHGNHGNRGKTHKYSGAELVLHEWIPELKEICDLIHKETKITFNSVLLNEYKDGKCSVGYHSDKEVTPPENAVVSVSFLGSRDFILKHKVSGVNHKVNLQNGDFLLMFGNTQKDYIHTIPVRAHADYRISATFRNLISH